VILVEAVVEAAVLAAGVVVISVAVAPPATGNR